MPNILMTWDGRRIVTLREKLGSATRVLSRRDLARLVNEQLPEAAWISESGVYRYEHGTEPPFAAAKVMASLAGMSIDEFMLGEDDILEEGGGGEPTAISGPAPDEPLEKWVPKKKRRRKGER